MWWLTKICFFNITSVASQKISRKSQWRFGWCVVFFHEKKVRRVCSRVLVEGNLQDSLFGRRNLDRWHRWVVFFPRHLKNMRTSNWIISPGIGMKITNIWNHQLFTSWWVCMSPISKNASGRQMGSSPLRDRSLFLQDWTLKFLKEGLSEWRKKGFFS